MIADVGVTVFIVICVIIGLAFALYNYLQVASIEVVPTSDNAQMNASAPLVNNSSLEQLKAVEAIQNRIKEGANAFLIREYKFMALFCSGMALVLLIVLGTTVNWVRGIFTVICFVCGASTSILSGFIGMTIAVFANARTCREAQRSGSYAAPFNVAFKAGCVMGFCLVSLGIIVLFILIKAIGTYFDLSVNTEVVSLYEAIAGYGLGGSTVALFGRVGGGIYTKAADVGADIVGKNEADMKEDDPRNPATIADNVGDNVGDIAGMGADLFGSFAEATCATIVVASNSAGLYGSWASLMFPVAISCSGILVCLITSFLATHLLPVKDKASVEDTLKYQIVVSTVLMTPVIFLISFYFLPHDGFTIGNGADAVTDIKYWHVFICVLCGLWSGMFIGVITEYYTSNKYSPVKEVAGSCETGAATNIIYGLALGYKSVIVPVICLTLTIYISYTLAGMFGIAVAAIGILSTLPLSLTIDAYGPICDNAGGIAEMSLLPETVRDITDALDAAGNTTAAVGKGFAIGSAALVSLALFGAFFTIVSKADEPQPQLTNSDISLLSPLTFAGLLIGAMLPFWFSAMTMKSVGLAANGMVLEVRDQFKKMKEGKQKDPDYSRCVGISTDHALREMVGPGALVLITPILVGFLFGVKALAGVLAGALVAGVQCAISAANSGGAWDNAKKLIEAEGHKGLPIHKAAVIGDTVGDPLKDTSGPSLNILIKLMAIIAVVFGPALSTIPEGLLAKWFS